MSKYRLLIILWPAFLMAGVLEMMVFSVVNPSDLQVLGLDGMQWSSRTIYSVSFLVFWAVISAASAITWLLHQTAEEINTQRFH